MLCVRSAGYAVGKKAFSVRFSRVHGATPRSFNFHSTHSRALQREVPYFHLRPCVTLPDSPTSCVIRVDTERFQPPFPGLRQAGGLRRSVKCWLCGFKAYVNVTHHKLCVAVVNAVECHFLCLDVGRGYI